MTMNWYYARGKQRVGPAPFTQLQQLAGSGQLHPGDMIFAEGTQKWVPAESVEELFPLPNLRVGTVQPAPAAVQQRLVRWAQAAMGRLPAAFLRGKSLQPFLRVGKLNS